MPPVHSLHLGVGGSHDTQILSTDMATVQVTFTDGAAKPQYRLDVADSQFAADDTTFTDEQLWLKNFPDTTSRVFMIAPDDAMFPSGTTVSATARFFHDGYPHADVSLPHRDIGGLTRVHLCDLTVSPDGTVVVTVPAVQQRRVLPGPAGRTRDLLRRHLETAAVTPVTAVRVIIDDSASMRLTASDEVLAAMAQFAAGVIDTVTGGDLSVTTTSAQRLDYESTAQLAEFDGQSLSRGDAGWRINPFDGEGTEPVVLFSDGLPADISSYRGPVHVLTSRTPLATTGVPYTHVDEVLIQSLRGEGPAADAILAERAQELWRTLISSGR